MKTREQTKCRGTQRSDGRDHIFAKEVGVSFMEDVTTAKYLKECGGFQLTEWMRRNSKWRNDRNKET